MTQDKKVCRRCGQEKSAESFGRLNVSGYAPKHICEECVQKQKNILESRKTLKREFHSDLLKRAAAMPMFVAQEQKRLEAILSKRGITKEEYEKVRDKQNGACAICQGQNEELIIDHCHATNKFRGLLCHSCNILLGQAKDRVETLECAIEYIKAGGAT